MLMFDMLTKFFNFCSVKNRNKLYLSVFLGVLDALFSALKIPAAFFAFTAIIENNIDAETFIKVIGFMLASTIGWSSTGSLN